MKLIFWFFLSLVITKLIDNLLLLYASVQKMPIYLCLLRFDSYTIPPQQLHNTHSHGSRPHTLGPTPCEGVLCSCCGVVVNLSFFLFIIITLYGNIFTAFRQVERRHKNPIWGFLFKSIFCRHHVTVVL
jgi:hypothetical protein